MKPDSIFRALEAFVGRMARTDDPRAHQDAAKRLQSDLERLKNQKTAEEKA